MKSSRFIIWIFLLTIFNSLIITSAKDRKPPFDSWQSLISNGEKLCLFYQSQGYICDLKDFIWKKIARNPSFNGFENEIKLLWLDNQRLLVAYWAKNNSKLNIDYYYYVNSDQWKRITEVPKNELRLRCGNIKADTFYVSALTKIQDGILLFINSKVIYGSRSQKLMLLNLVQDVFAYGAERKC